VRFRRGSKRRSREFSEEGKTSCMSFYDILRILSEILNTMYVLPGELRRISLEQSFEGFDEKDKSIRKYWTGP